MKKLKIAGVILSSLFSVAAFAAGSTVLKYDLSNQDTKDAKGDNHYYYCDLKTKDDGNAVKPTVITFTISGNGVIFEQGGTSLNNVSVDDLKNKYFNVKKGAGREESSISYSTNNATELNCDKGKGGRTAEYTGQ